MFLLSYKDSYYFYCEDKKVFAKTEKGVFKLKQRLYELEGLVEGRGFIKLSASTIGAIDKIDHFELSFKGSLCVVFKNKDHLFASRRYTSNLKRELGL